MYVCGLNVCVPGYLFCACAYDYSIQIVCIFCGFRCGLAEQLDRLLSQQRSEKTLWYHQVFRQQDHPGNENYCKVIKISICVFGQLFL